MNRKTAHGRPCPYCQRQMDLHSNRLQPTRDHIVPQARGGRAIIICCLQCNGIKGNMMPSEWESFMAAYPRWWMLSKYDLRAIWRAPRVAARNAKWGPRKPPRQGTPPMPPIVVPPGLIYAKVLSDASNDGPKRDMALRIIGGEAPKDGAQPVRPVQ